MPTYVYRCDSCHTVFEVEQRITESPLTVCVHCKADGTIKRLLSASPFHLKGGGWYKTDYPSSSSGKSAGATSGQSSSSGSGDTTTSAKSESSESTTAASSTTTEKNTAEKSSPAAPSTVA